MRKKLTINEPIVVRLQTGNYKITDKEIAMVIFLVASYSVLYAVTTATLFKVFVMIISISSHSWTH